MVKIKSSIAKGKFTYLATGTDSVSIPEVGTAKRILPWWKTLLGGGASGYDSF